MCKACFDHHCHLPKPFLLICSSSCLVHSPFLICCVAYFPLTKLTKECVFSLISPPMPLSN